MVKRNVFKGEKTSIVRCSWCTGDPVLEHYHDTEWGIPEKSDDRLFERLAMQIFQAGLNWKMILEKRPAFNRAFKDFSIEKVARFDSRRLARLLGDESIIRNRRKIEAVIENARRLMTVKAGHGSFMKYLESLPADLKSLQKELGERFVFMGPEVTRMFVMSIGKVGPVHEKRCYRYAKPARK